MKREEYLSTLERALEKEAVAAETRTDVVREMDSHIEELLARRGELSEEDVVASLTPPELLARALGEEFGGARPTGTAFESRQAEGPRSDAEESESGKEESSRMESGRRRRGRVDGLGAAIQTLVDEALEGLESGLEGGAEALRQKSHRFSREWKERGRDFSRFHGEDFARGVREAVRSFASWSPRGSVRYESALDLAEARTLRLDFMSADVRVSGGRAASISIAIEGEEGELDSWTPSISRAGEILFISEPRNTQVHASRVELVVPPSIDRLELFSLSGEIEIGRLAVAALARTKSGDIEAEGLRTFFAQSLSGDITARDVSGELEASTASGDVAIEDVGGEAVVTTKSGDISATGIRGEAKLESASGDIELEAGSGFPGGKVESISGDISVKLDSPDLAVRARTVSGEIDAPGDEDDKRLPRSWSSKGDRVDADLSIGSVSGDLRITFD